MSDIQWDSSQINEQNLVNNTNDQEDYKNGLFYDLGTVFNTGFGSYNYGKELSKPIPTDSLPAEEYNINRVNSVLKKQGVPQETIDEVIRHPGNRDWESLFRNLESVKNKQQALRHIHDKLPTAISVPLGLTFGLVDIDAPLIGGVYKATTGLFKATKFLNNAGKASAIFKGAVTGATIGMTSNYANEALTGQYTEDSTVNSAVLGMLLGGTAGLFFGRGKNIESLTQHVDTSGEKPIYLKKEEAKVEAIKRAKEKQADIDDLVTQITEAKKDKQKLKVLLEAEELRKDSLINRKAYSDTSNILEEIKGLKQERQKANRDLVEAFNKNNDFYDQEVKFDFAKQQYSFNTKKISELKSTVKQATLKKERAEKWLKANEGKITAKPKAIKQRRDSLAEANSILSSKGILLGTYERAVQEFKLKTLPSYANIKNGIKATERSKENLTKIVKEVSNKIKTKEKNIEEINKAQEDLRKYEASGKDDRRMALVEQLGGVNKLLSSEGLADLVKTKSTVQQHLDEFYKGNLKPSKFYKMQIEQANLVDKLTKELDEVSQIKDFRTNPLFKKLPEWARKLTISPIEKLLNDPDELVSGMASMLHSGTLHHGLTNTHTASAIRKKLDVKVSRIQSSMLHNFREAKAGGYEGDIHKFNTEVTRNTRLVAGDIQRKLNEAISGDVSGEQRELIIQERANSIKREHVSGNKWVDKSVDDVLNYFEEIHAYGKKLGIETFEKALPKGYVKRVYALDKIKKLGREEAIERITNAQESYAIAHQLPVQAGRRAIFKEKATLVVDKVLDGISIREQVTQPLGTPRSTLEASLKERTIRAFEDDLDDVLSDDIIATTHIYGLGIHGRLALKEKLGVYTDSDLEELFNISGLKGKNLDRMRVLVETIKGTRELSRSPFNPFTRATKMLSSYTSMMHTMGFVIPTITEVASLSKEFGWSKTIDNLIGRPSEVLRIYKNGSPSEKNTVEMMISYGDAVFNHRVTRLDAEGSLDSVGKMQQFMDGVIHKQAVFSGLLPLTDMFRMSTASLTVDFLAGLSVRKNIPKTDIKRLNDIGFQVEDLPTIKEVLKVSEDGRIGNTNRKSWGKLDDAITEAVLNMVDRTILHPDGATLPMFMTDMNTGAFLPRIMFKFMRFPMESYERLLLRGIQEADAKQATSFIGSIGLWTMVLALKDSVKDESKQKYRGDKGTNQLMIDSFLMNSYTSAPFLFLDTLSGIATGKNLTSDMPFSYGGANYSSLRNLQQGHPKFNIAGVNIDLADVITGILTKMKIMEENHD